jgi:molybdate transport system ATP-binding protein
VLQQVGLAGYASRTFLSLSYGQRRRVLLARAVVRKPDLLLLDEVLNGLDARGRAAFLRALRLASSPRTAWIMTSHRRGDAPANLTHVARIARGGIASITDLRAGAADPSASRPEARPGIALAAQRKAPGASRTRSAQPLLRLRPAAVYREERLVSGMFDWTLEPGQHWCLRGANGAGKSTFVAMLYGDLWPAHGGRRERQWPVTDDWKARVGLVSPELQARYAATRCTVEQIVASGFHASIGLNARPTLAELRCVRRELRAWGLADLATRQARELSYGQLRLALVARAFVRPRSLWLLDEPFDGLDTEARQRLRARLDRTVSRGATVVMATHHEEDVPGYVTRVLQLRRGRAPVITNR